MNFYKVPTKMVNDKEYQEDEFKVGEYYELRKDGVTYAQGKIVNVKTHPFTVISFEGKFFFNPTKFTCIKLRNSCDTILTSQNFKDLRILPWRTENKQADIFVEHTYEELDRHCVVLCNILNRKFGTTVVSCDGHYFHKYWISLFVSTNGFNKLLLALQPFLKILDVKADWRHKYKEDIDKQKLYIQIESRRIGMFFYKYLPQIEERLENANKEIF